MAKCVGKIVTLSEEERDIVLESLRVHREANDDGSDDQYIAIIDSLIANVDGPLDEWHE